MNTIIDVDYVIRYFQFSKNIDRLAIERAIREAQALDLPKWLCDAYLIEVVNRPNDFTDLLEYHEWETDGKKYFHNGLRLAIAYFSAARYLREKVGVDTPFGFVEKKTEWSENVDENRRKKLANEYEKIAERYMEKIDMFLKMTDYGYYSTYCPRMCVDDNFRLTITAIKKNDE